MTQGLTREAMDPPPGGRTWEDNKISALQALLSEKDNELKQLKAENDELLKRVEDLQALVEEQRDLLYGRPINA